MNVSRVKRKISAPFIRILFSLLVVCGLSFGILHVYAKPFQQVSKKILEEKKKKLQQEIEYQKQLLNDVKGQKNSTMITVAIINNKIKDHEELINTIASQINELNGQINETRTSIKTKEEEIQKLKDDYAKMVFAAYKNRSSYDRLMFIFSATDFNQAYQRLKYFQVFSELRKKQGGELIGKKKELNASLLGLEQKRTEQSSLLTDKEAEKLNLSAEKDNKTLVLTELQNKESDIKDEIRKKKVQADKIKKLIDKLIADEIKKQQEILAQKNKDNPKKNTDPKKVKKDNEPKIELTPEEQLVSKNFEGNQGKLPWPLTQGVITERFGPHEHPDLPGIEINSTGLEITSNKGAIARTIFDGEVTVVAEIGYIEGKVVMIRHGEYLSVYYSLENVYVKPGDKVKTKDEIGKVITDDNGKTELHLEVYKGKTLMNPEDWIVVKN